MFTGKGLLLSCIVIMHISFTAAQSFKRATFQKKMKDTFVTLARCNLKTAEKDYVNVMFPDSSLSVQRSPGALEGITFGNSTEEVQTSACAISDYLDKHLPAIIKSLTENYEDILKNTTTFLNEFNTAVKQSSDQNEPKECRRNVTDADDYNKKQIGFQIIHLTRRWVEVFTGTNTTCQHDEDNA